MIVGHVLTLGVSGRPGSTAVVEFDVERRLRLEAAAGRVLERLKNALAELGHADSACPGCREDRELIRHIEGQP
jgi:hypothetical protein